MPLEKQVVMPRALQKALSIVVCYRSDEEEGGLDPKTKIVLAEIVRCANAKDLSTSIRIRKEVMETNTGLSQRSIYRALDILEEGGWIARKEQIKSRRAGFQIGEISLTTEACAILSPVEEVNHKTSSSSMLEEGCSLSPSTNLADALTCFSNKEQFLQRQPAGSVFHHQKNISNPTQMSTRVPEDCQPLLSHLTEPAIFKLMKIATSRNKRLGQIVTYAQPALEKARDPYALMLTLITQDIDYVWLAEQKRRNEEGRAAKQQQATELKTWIGMNLCKMLYSQDGLTQFTGNQETHCFEVAKRTSVGEQFVPQGLIPAAQLAQSVTLGNIQITENVFSTVAVTPSQTLSDQLTPAQSARSVVEMSAENIVAGEAVRSDHLVGLHSLKRTLRIALRSQL